MHGPYTYRSILVRGRMKCYVFIEKLAAALRDFPWRVDNKPLVIRDASGHTFKMTSVTASAEGLNMLIEKDEEEFFDYEKEGA